MNACLKLLLFKQMEWWEKKFFCSFIFNFVSHCCEFQRAFCDCCHFWSWNMRLKRKPVIFIEMDGEGCCSHFICHISRSQIRQVNNDISGIIIFSFFSLSFLPLMINNLLYNLNIYTESSFLRHSSILLCFIIWQLHTHTWEPLSTDTLLYR